MATAKCGDCGGQVSTSVNEGLLIGMVHSLQPDVEGDVDQCVRSDIIRAYLGKLKIELYAASE
jgi:hypothetical protein